LDEETLDRAFGERRVSYFVHGLGLSGQFLIGLNVGAPTRLLPDGNYLFSGCRHHSCHEKAAVIATPSGSILAGGLIHFQCLGADEQPLPDPCDDKHRLAVFVKPTDASAPHYRSRLGRGPSARWTSWRCAPSAELPIRLLAEALLASSSRKAHPP
jgi:hypothetical protein